MANPSFRKAVDAMCRRCSYDPLDIGTWRQQVGRCADSDCPLHPLRPMPQPRMGSSGNGLEGAKTKARGDSCTEATPSVQDAVKSACAR